MYSKAFPHYANVRNNLKLYLEIIGVNKFLIFLFFASNQEIPQKPLVQAFLSKSKSISPPGLCPLGVHNRTNEFTVLIILILCVKKKYKLFLAKGHFKKIFRKRTNTVLFSVFPPLTLSFIFLSDTCLIFKQLHTLGQWKFLNRKR